MSVSKTRAAIEYLVAALDEVPVSDAEGQEAVKRLGIDVEAWARRRRIMSAARRLPSTTGQRDYGAARPTEIVGTVGDVRLDARTLAWYSAVRAMERDGVAVDAILQRAAANMYAWHTASQADVLAGGDDEGDADANDSDKCQSEALGRKAAAEMTALLRMHGLVPDRTLADPDGGIALYLFSATTRPGGSHARYARVVATNGGDVAVLCVDRDKDEPKTWAVLYEERIDAVERIREFLGDGK